MSNNVKQPSIRDLAVNIVEIIVAETRTDIANQISGDGSRNPSITKIDGHHAIEALVNQQVIQALERAKSEAKDIGFGNGEMVSVWQLDNLIKEYKGE